MMQTCWLWGRPDQQMLHLGGLGAKMHNAVKLGIWIYTRIYTWWWFQIFFMFYPYLGKIPILTDIFQGGWNHQPVYIYTHESDNLNVLEYSVL